MAYPVRVMKGIDISLWQKEDYDFVRLVHWRGNVTWQM